MTTAATELQQGLEDLIEKLQALDAALERQRSEIQHGKPESIQIATSEVDRLLDEVVRLADRMTGVARAQGARVEDVARQLGLSSLYDTYREAARRTDRSLRLNHRFIRRVYETNGAILRVLSGRQAEPVVYSDPLRGRQLKVDSSARFLDCNA